MNELIRIQEERREVEAEIRKLIHRNKVNDFIMDLLFVLTIALLVSFVIVVML